MIIALLFALLQQNSELKEELEKLTATIEQLKIDVNTTGYDIDFDEELEDYQEFVYELPFTVQEFLEEKGIDLAQELKNYRERD